MPSSPFPKELQRTFHVQKGTRKRTEDGHSITYADQTPDVSFVGVIADADTRALMIAQQAGYAVTNMIVSSEAALASHGDRLRCEAVPARNLPERFFQVEEVQNPGDMGMFTLYYTEQVGG